MDPTAYDPSSLLYGDDASVQQKAAAMAAALRGQQAMGQLMQMGGRQIAGPGASIAAQASQGQQQMLGALEKRPQMLLQAQEAEKNRLQAQQAQTTQDARANPAYAGFLRKSLATLAPNISGPELQSAPVGALEEMLKPAAQVASHRASLDANLPFRQAAADARARGLADKEENDVQRVAAQQAKSWDPAQASGRTTFGQAGTAVFQGGRVLAALHAQAAAGADPKTNPMQLSIAADSLNKMVGAPSTNQAIASITPKNVALTGAGIMQWLFSEPMGVDQQKWVQAYEQIVSAEEANANKLIRESQLKNTQGIKSLLRRGKMDEARQLIIDHGLDQPHPSGYIDTQTFEIKKPGATQDSAAPAAAPTGKQVVKTQQNKSTGKKRDVYADGTYGPEY